jgi:hypothetical protein
MHEMIQAAVAFAEEKLPLQHMMPSGCALVNKKRRKKPRTPRPAY